MERCSTADHKDADRLVSSAREEWEATFDAVQDLVSIIDAEHTIARVNRSMAEYCAVRREDLIGRKCYEVIHGTPAPPENCPHVKSLRDGVVHREQVEEKGLKRVFDVTVSPVRNSEGGVAGCVHVARDVTARVRIEGYGSAGRDILHVLGDKESQKEGIERVIGLVKAATGVDAVGIRLEEGDDYPYFFHEGFASDFLQKESSLIARTREGGVCRDAGGDVCLECACGVVITGRTDPAKPYFTSGGSCWTNDAQAILELSAGDPELSGLRHECIHSGYSSVALVPIRANGRIVGLLQLNAYRKGCFTRDTIETLEDIAANIGEALLRKQAEEKLVASERFLRTLTDQIPGMVGYWSRDLRCIFANSGYQEWFGRTREEMVGISMQELLGEELFALNEPHIAKVLQGEPQRFQRRVVKPSGEAAEVLAHYVPDLEGEATGFFILVSDITELKRAEEEKVKLEVELQQAQKMESIGRLAGGVAHDFNNMLGVIIGHAELSLFDMRPSDHPYDSLVEIRDAAERSANLTRQLLAFARKQTISPRVMNLNSTVSGMLKMLQRLIGEDIHLTWLPDPQLWRVKADPGQIDQILANLCINARDAIADTGRVTIRTQNATIGASYCKEHPEAVPGEYVRLTVTDDGCGMDRHTLKNIFEPFYTTKDLGQGTGLGLATVFGIVKQNNGCIDVYSIPGEGTTFSIYLPRLDEATLQATADAALQPLPEGHETVLIVEDEPTILMMAAMMLEHQGYTVLSAGSPQEALDLAVRHAGEIDLLLTDVIMPTMNGKDLAKELLSSYPSLKCLYMSGYTADVIAHHGVLHESVNFIQKPFSLPDLASQVRNALDR